MTVPGPSWAGAWAALPQVISIIHPENERSQRVARKQGMEIEGRVFNPVIDRDVDVWFRDAPA